MAISFRVCEQERVSVSVSGDIFYHPCYVFQDFDGFWIIDLKTHQTNRAEHQATYKWCVIASRYVSGSMLC